MYEGHNCKGNGWTAFKKYNYIYEIILLANNLRIIVAKQTKYRNEKLRACAGQPAQCPHVLCSKDLKLDPVCSVKQRHPLCR